MAEEKVLTKKEQFALVKEKEPVAEVALNYNEEILKVRRVSTKRSGGSNFHYSVLAVVGDNNGNVGIALAKSKENSNAIRKAKDKAKRSMIKIPLTKDKSIPHEIFIRNGASILFLKPAPLGAGIIAGSSIRRIMELAGIRNVSAKIIGTNNQISNAYTLMDAFRELNAGFKGE